MQVYNLYESYTQQPESLCSSLTCWSNSVTPRCTDLSSQVRKKLISGRCRIMGLDSHSCTKPFNSATFRGSMLLCHVRHTARCMWGTPERKTSNSLTESVLFTWSAANVNTSSGKLGALTSSAWMSARCTLHCNHSTAHINQTIPVNHHVRPYTTCINHYYNDHKLEVSGNVNRSVTWWLFDAWCRR